MHHQTALNLSIGYHNIAGNYDKSHGCKINTQITLLNDIEILSETWSECDKCKHNMIPKYILLKNIEPQKAHGQKKR